MHTILGEVIPKVDIAVAQLKGKLECAAEKRVDFYSLSSCQKLRRMHNQLAISLRWRQKR